MRYDLVVIGTSRDAVERARAADTAGRLVGWVVPTGTVPADDLGGIDVLRGEPRFVSEHALSVFRRDDELRIESERFVIATGTRAGRPSRVPFDGERVLDGDEIDQLSPEVRTVVVIGAGVDGLRAAANLAEAGRHVIVVDGGEQGLEGFDAHFGDELQRARSHGVDLRLGDEGLGVERDAAGVRVVLGNGRILTADAAVIVERRFGRTEGLGLEAIGVGLDEIGRIWCDADGQSWVPSVEAIGDVASRSRRAVLPMEDVRPVATVDDVSDALLPLATGDEAATAEAVVCEGRDEANIVSIASMVRPTRPARPATPRPVILAFPGVEGTVV